MSEETMEGMSPYEILRMFQGQCAMGAMQILQGNRTAMVTAHEFDVDEQYRGDEPDLPPKLTVVLATCVIEGGTEDAKDLTAKIAELCFPYFDEEDSQEFTEVAGVTHEITKQ